MFCWLVPWRYRMFQMLWLEYNHNRRVIRTRVVWRWQRSNPNNPSTHHVRFRFLEENWKHQMPVWTKDLDKAIAEAGRSYWNIQGPGENRSQPRPQGFSLKKNFEGKALGTRLNRSVTKRGYCKLYSKERHIGDLVFAVRVFGRRRSPSSHARKTSGTQIISPVVQAITFGAKNIWYHEFHTGFRKYFSVNWNDFCQGELNLLVLKFLVNI